MNSSSSTDHHASSCSPAALPFLCLSVPHIYQWGPNEKKKKLWFSHNFSNHRVSNKSISTKKNQITLVKKVFKSSVSHMISMNAMTWFHQTPSALCRSVTGHAFRFFTFCLLSFLIPCASSTSFTSTRVNLRVNFIKNISPAELRVKEGTVKPKPIKSWYKFWGVYGGKSWCDVGSCRQIFDSSQTQFTVRLTQLQQPLSKKKNKKINTHTHISEWVEVD